ncbi:MAG TPA: hypothetical protein GXZ90_09760 [Clostridiales bacterium]|nr:hypothetical protein [Clostridiales bacterium]
MNIFDSLNSRKSIRKYTNERIDFNILNEIIDYANNLTGLFENIDVEFHIIENTNKFKSFGFFNIKAPYYLCISSVNSDDSNINAGYLMQQISLYLSTIGLGSCIISTPIPKHLEQPDFKYEYITALAFGYTNEDLFRDKIDSVRLSEDKVVYYKMDVSRDIKEIINAARLSPSYLNNQPWKFIVYQNRIHLFVKKSPVINMHHNKYRMLDIGTALANLLIAAEEYWINTSITKLEALKDKPFKQNDYVLTVLIDTNVHCI